MVDDSELKLGTNPKNPDSDGDGIQDGADSYSNQRIVGDVATLLVDGVGDVSKNTTNVNASGYVALIDMPGSIGNTNNPGTACNTWQVQYITRGQGTKKPPDLSVVVHDFLFWIKL